MLIILLINAPDHLESSHPALQRTEALLRSLTRASACPGIVCYDAQRHLDILIVDLVSAGKRVPHRKGVGVIRKLGADIALSLIHNQHIHKPWIFCTDADVLLPEGYFQVLNMPVQNSGADVAAIVLPYRHFLEKKATQTTELLLQHLRDQETASQLYELHMRYFTNRLGWSGSPYAYSSIGSLLVISANHYAMVRGFPGRPAAEDFYLLNKLAKVGLIACPVSPLVQLQARYSTRVPFGTGPALLKILESGERLTYAPQSFDLLKLFYTELTQMKILPISSQALWTSTLHHDPNATMLLLVLDKIGFEKFIVQQLKQCKTRVRLVRAIHEWFDAFRILKFLHAARDLGNFDIPVLQALSRIYPEARCRSHDYLAFLCNLEQSETQHKGLGRYAGMLPT